MHINKWKRACLVALLLAASVGIIYFLIYLRDRRNSTPETPVKVDIFYETKCPDSIRFIKDQMWPVFTTLYGSGIVDLNLYAYGNTEEKKTESGGFQFSCQHGALECHLDTIESCVGFLYPKKEDGIEFVYCVANNASLNGAQKCAEKLKMDWGTILRCSQGPLGSKLTHEAGVATPMHTFIPWIVIDDDSSPQTFFRDHLRKAICERYKGYKRSECDEQQTSMSRFFSQFWH